VDRAQKVELVTSLNQVFQNAGVVVVAHYAGLTVKQMTELRGEMKQAGATVKVAKNRLVKLALPGTPPEGITDLFSGPTLIAYSDDPVAAPKAAIKFAKDNEQFAVLGGAMGAQVLNVEGVKSLASLPSLDELRGNLVRMLQTPATRIAMLTKAPAGQLARVLNAHAQKGEAA